VTGGERAGTLSEPVTGWRGRRRETVGLDGKLQDSMGMLRSVNKGMRPVNGVRSRGNEGCGVVWCVEMRTRREETYRSVSA
jgi:hypothetical protein